MLIRLIYVSTAVGPVTTSVTGTILRSAQAHNARSGITGVLCQGQGLYMQVLEGERAQLEALYARILKDKRHDNVVRHQDEDIKARRYGNWAMAHVDLAHSTASQQAAYPTTQGAFTPYAATAGQVMAKIDKLIATGKVMTAPVV